jgi:hypothetical protein
VLRPKPVKPTGERNHIAARQEEQAHFWAQFEHREPRTPDQPQHVFHDIPRTIAKAVTVTAVSVVAVSA